MVSVSSPLYRVLLQRTHSSRARLVRSTRLTIAADPRHLGATIGVIAVLHTWGQTLVFHPHLHCVVPGGGLSPCQGHLRRTEGRTSHDSGSVNKTRGEGVTKPRS
jgi:hypothetical protein